MAVVFEIEIFLVQASFSFQFIQKRFEWCNENCPWADDYDDEKATEQSKLLHDLYQGEKPPVRLAVNLRDLPEAFATNPERVFKVVEFLTTLPEVGA